MENLSHKRVGLICLTLLLGACSGGAGVPGDPNSRRDVAGLVIQAALNRSEAQDLLISNPSLAPNFTPEADQKLFFTAEAYIANSVGSLFETRTERTVLSYQWDIDGDGRDDYRSEAGSPALLVPLNQDAPADWEGRGLDCEMVDGQPDQLACNAPARQKQYQARLILNFDMQADVDRGLCAMDGRQNKTCNLGGVGMFRQYTLLASAAPITSPVENRFRARLRVTEPCLDGAGSLRESDLSLCRSQSNFAASSPVGLHVEYDLADSAPVNPSYRIADGSGNYRACGGSDCDPVANGFFVVNAPSTPGTHSVEIEITDNNPDAADRTPSLVTAEYTVGAQAEAQFQFEHEYQQAPSFLTAYPDYCAPDNPSARDLCGAGDIYKPNEYAYIKPAGSRPSDRRFGEITRYTWSWPNANGTMTSVCNVDGEGNVDIAGSDSQCFAGGGVWIPVRHRVGVHLVTLRVEDNLGNAATLSKSYVFQAAGITPQFTADVNFYRNGCVSGSPAHPMCAAPYSGDAAPDGDLTFVEGERVRMSAEEIERTVYYEYHEDAQSGPPQIVRSVWNVNGAEIRCELADAGRPAECENNLTAIRPYLPFLETNELTARSIGVSVQLTDSFGAQYTVHKTVTVASGGGMTACAGAGQTCDPRANDRLFAPGEPIRMSFYGAAPANTTRVRAHWRVRDENGVMLNADGEPCPGCDATATLSGVVSLSMRAPVTSQNLSVEVTGVYQADPADASPASDEVFYRTVRRQWTIQRDLEIRFFEDCTDFETCDPVRFGYNPQAMMTVVASQGFEAGHAGIRRMEWIISGSPQRTITCNVADAQDPIDCRVAGRDTYILTRVPDASGFFNVQLILTETNGTRYQLQGGSAVLSQSPGPGGGGNPPDEEDVSDPGVQAAFNTYLLDGCHWYEVYGGAPCGLGDLFRSSGGQHMGLDARASTSTHGPIVGYEWDFDGDGDFDDETMETCDFNYGSGSRCGYWPVPVNYMNQPVAGRYQASPPRVLRTGAQTIRLRVTDSQGNRGYASARVCLDLCDLSQRFYDYGPTDRALDESELLQSRVTLNDTGLNRCFSYTTDEFENNVYGYDCPAAGWPGQDAQSGRDSAQNDPSDGPAGFSFMKHRYENGSRVPVALSAAYGADSRWDCVEDRTTGLFWEVKTDDGGLFDAAHRYSWYRPDPSLTDTRAGVTSPNVWQGAANPPVSDCGPLAACNTQAYIDAVNAAQRCGFNDWRLPTVQEWLSIVDFQSNADQRVVGENVLPNLQWSGYWTGTPDYVGIDRNTRSALAVTASDGSVQSNSHAYINYVLLVRGGTPPATTPDTNITGQRKDRYPELASAPGQGNAIRCRRDVAGENAPRERYRENGDGTVTDVVTGLMWTQCLEGQTLQGSLCTSNPTNRDWPGALQAAEDSTYAGHGDWRLPNVKELATLLEHGCRDYKMNADVFPAGTPESFMPQGFPLWSSTFEAHGYEGEIYGSYEAWSVSFQSGEIWPAPHTMARPFRLVRDAR